jgi:hypothetical protein
MAWLRYRMNLSTSPQNSLIMGELQVFQDNDAQPQKVLPVTSGIPPYQHLLSEDLVGKGPIPACKTVGIDGYFINTTPLDRSQKVGIEGNFYWIDKPERVTINGVGRSEFGLHFDGNVPGSAGCIVFPNRTDWAWFENFMKDYNKQGFSHIGLIVEYNQVDPLPSNSILTILNPKSEQTVIVRQPFSFSGKAKKPAKLVKVTADPPANHPVGQTSVDGREAWTIPVVLVSTGQNRSFKVSALDAAGTEVDSVRIQLNVVTHDQIVPSTSVFSIEEPQSGEQRRIRSSIRFSGKASPIVKRIVANVDAGGRPVTIGTDEPKNGKWSFTQALVSSGERWISFIAQDSDGHQLQVIKIRITLLPGPLDLNKLPISHDGEDFRSAAKPHLPTLVKAFQDQGIFSPNVYAFACSSICRESSWNPRAQNTTDDAANTGYPGRGLAQITWKYNYEEVSKATSIDFVNNPDLMFDPYNSLRAKAAYYQLNKMTPYIESGDFESAAGKYNAGNPNFRSEYTHKVAKDTPLWLPAFVSA